MVDDITVEYENTTLGVTYKAGFETVRATEMFMDALRGRDHLEKRNVDGI